MEEEHSGDGQENQEEMGGGHAVKGKGSDLNSVPLMLGQSQRTTHFTWWARALYL